MKNAGLTLSIALKVSLGRTGTVTWWRTWQHWQHSFGRDRTRYLALLSALPHGASLPFQNALEGGLIFHQQLAVSRSFFHRILCRQGRGRPTAACRKEAKGSPRCLQFHSGTQFCDPSPCPSQTLQLQPHTPNPASIASPGSSRFRAEPPSPHPPSGRLLASSGARPGPGEPPQPRRLPQGELGGRVVPSAAPAGGAGGAGAGASARKMAAAACVPVRVCHQEIVRFDLEIKAAVQVAPPGAPSPHRGRGSPPLSPRPAARAPSVSSGWPPLTGLLFFRISGTARGRWAPSRSSTRPWRRNSGTSGAASRWGWRGWAEGGLEAVRVLIPRINGC